MSTFYEMWVSHSNRAGYPTLNAFLLENDPKGKAFQTTTKRRTSIPGPERIAKWAKALGLNKKQTAEWQSAADYDRVVAAADGEELGPGIRMLQSELAQLRNDAAKLRDENAALRAQLDAAVNVLRDLDTQSLRLHEHGLQLPPEVAALLKA